MPNPSAWECLWNYIYVGFSVLFTHSLSHPPQIQFSMVQRDPIEIVLRKLQRAWVWSFRKNSQCPSSLSLSLCAESLDLRPTSVCLHLSLSFMCPFRPNPKWGKPCSTTSPVPRGLQHPVWSDENSSWWLYGSGNQVSVFRCLEIYCFCLVLWAQGDNKRIIPTLWL